MNDTDRTGRHPDAQASQVLAQRAAAGGLPMHQATLTASRAAQWEWLPYMGELAPMADVQTRFIAAPTAEIPVRIYRPPNPAGTTDGPRPALVAFHGGCWVVGNIDVSERPHRDLAAATGCVVIAVNYQKAPEHPFPVPLDDCYSGYLWVLDQAEALGLDPQRIGVVGDSAGGNLAAAVCLAARDRGDVLPAVQVLLYPAVDAELDTDSARDFAEGFGLSTADMRWSWEQYVPEAALRADPLVSPLRAPSLALLPPAVVVTAEFDVLRDEGQRYADRLEADGVHVARLHYDGTIHGFWWMATAVHQCRQMLADVAAELTAIWG